MTHRKARGLFLTPALFVLIGACGGGGGGDDDDDDDTTAPDASTQPDAADTSGCYQEASDATNDSAGEISGRTLTATGDVQLCGQIDAREPDQMLIDADIYQFEVGVTSTVRITVSAPGGDAIGDVAVFLYANPIADATADFLAVGNLVGDHAVLLGPSCFTHPACASPQLPPGTYNLIVQATGITAPAAAVPYQATITTYDPATGCVTPGTTAHVEALDVAGGAPADDNTQNDVYQLVADFPNTTDATDVSEDSGAALTIVPATSYLATGLAGAHTAANSYLDVDTYTIVTGAETNTLDIELSWTGGGADDLDWYLIGDGATVLDPPVNVQNGGTIANPEVQATAVAPNTTYQLVVGAYTGTAVDLGYQLTVCGSTYTP